MTNLDYTFDFSLWLKRGSRLDSGEIRSVQLDFGTVKGVNPYKQSGEVVCTVMDAGARTSMETMVIREGRIVL